MSSDAKAEKGPYITANYRINQIIEKYGREPNINEIRAIEELPLGKEKDLWDTSANGRRIYHLLKTSEANRDVSLLDEAGQLLWEQIFRKPFSEANELSRLNDHYPPSIPLIDLEYKNKMTQGYSKSENNSNGSIALVQELGAKERKVAEQQEDYRSINPQGQNEKKAASGLSSVPLKMPGCPGCAKCQYSRTPSSAPPQ